MRKLSSQGLCYTVYKDARKGLPSSGRYYARLSRPEILDYPSFVDSVIERNGVASRGVVRGIVDDVVDELVHQVLTNHSVRLSDLGIFSLSLHTHGETDPSKFTISNVAKGLELQFLPNREGINRLTQNVLLGAATLTERSDYSSPLGKKTTTADGTTTTSGTGTTTGSGTGTDGSGTNSGSGTGSDLQP